MDNSDYIIPEELKGIIKKLNEKDYPKEWRKGQACFNLCQNIYPNEVDKLRGTGIDCFYRDKNIEVFLDNIVKQLKYG